MFSVNCLQTIAIFQLIFCISLTSPKMLTNKNNSVNVLAVNFPPFTYFDVKYGFVGGIDIRLLRTITERLNLNMILNKVDHIPTENLE